MDSISKVGQLRPIRPSIIIGLGGTGQRILLELRRRIVEEYGELDRLPIVGFLVIDTDAEKPILPSMDEDSLRKIQLNPSEFFHAKVTGTQKLKEELRSYPHLAEWVDKSILERGDITVGAKGIRAIGRLAYFLNFGQIKKAFNTIYSQIVDQPNLRYMAENHGVQVATGVNVFIITSVCGGTGSGMFLDLAFTVKDLLAGVEHQRIGYMVLPGVFGTDMAKAAGYAALRELNHYNMDRDFEANWENEPRARVIQPPPFDFCYIVNNSNGKVNLSRKEHLFEMLAHNIFLEFAHDFGQYKASLKDNLQAMAIGTDRLGCPLNYISLGLSSINFPRERIINACSYRLGREMVDKWLTNSGDQGRLNEFLDHFLDYNKMFVDIDSARKNQLKDELLTINGSNFYSRVDDEMTAVYRGLSNQKHENYDQFIQRKEEDFEKKFYDGDQDPNRWGEFYRGIFKNREKKISLIKELLEKTVSDMMGNEKEGIDYSKAFLSALEDRLVRYRDYFRTKFDEISKAESSFVKQKGAEYELLKGYKNKFVFDKKKVMQDQADKLINTRSGKVTIYFKRKLDKKILEQLIILCKDVSEYARYIIREIDLFKEKLARIRKSLADSEKTLTQEAGDVNVYSLSLYEPGDIHRYYTEYVTQRDQQMDSDTLSMLTNKVNEELGCKNFFELRKEDFSDRRVKDAIIKHSKPCFSALKEVTVAKKFFEKYPTESEQGMHLRNIFTSSEVFLSFRHVPDFNRLPNSKVSLIGVHQGRQPSLPEFKEMLPLLERSCSEPDQLKGIQPIRQKEEILFTTEEGAFPLRMINEIEDYENKYDKLSRGQQNPLHLRKDDKDYLIEIILPTEDEQRKAKIAVYMGLSLGIIRADEDDPNLMVYCYRDPATGFVETKTMGKKNEEERMIDTLLHRFNRELRGIIYNDVVTRLSGVARNNIEKGKIWHRINAYRDDYRKRRDREFIEKKKIMELFKEVIAEFQLFDPAFVEEGV